MHTKTIIYITTISLFFVCIGCSGFRKWDKDDQRLFISYNVLSAIDGALTIAGRDDHGELNPLLRGDEGKPDTVRVVGVKAGASLGLFYLLDTESLRPIRTRALWILNGLQGGAIVWNLANW